VLEGGGGAAGVTWQGGSGSRGATVARLETETRAGALALREVSLVLRGSEGEEGGTESWRDLAGLRGDGVEMGLRVGNSWECCALEGILFDGFVRGRVESSLDAAGRENMEASCWGDLAAASPITRDFVNCRHNESRSAGDAEGEQGKAAGVRNHSTGGSSDAGRRGGGYVVGNA